MGSYFVLLQPYLLQFRNHVAKSDDVRGTLKRDLLLLGVTALLLLCIYAGVLMVLKSVEDDLLFRELIPSKLIELLCYVFFILQLLGATIAFVGNVYHSESMNLHLSTPISQSRLFFGKWVETFYETTFMFVIFTLPIGIAYVRVLQLPLHFLATAIVVIVPFLVIANSLGFILATLVTYGTALFWKRGFVLLLALFTVSGWLMVQVFSWLSNVQLQQGGGNAIVTLIGLFDNPNAHWMPGHWASQLLNAYLSGQSQGSSLSMLLLCASAGGSLAAAYLVFDYCLLPVRSRVFSHDGGHFSGTRVQRVDLTRNLIERLYHALPLDQALRAVILKDMTSLFRDKSQSLKLLMYLGIAVSYLALLKFMSSALLLNIFGLSFWWAFLAAMNTLFGGFIVTAVMTRLVYPSISLEGRAFWIMNSAPLALRDLIRAKFYCWLPLTIAVSCGLFLAGILLIYPQPIAILYTLFLAVLLSIGCCGLAVGIGAVFARFEWESANQISSGLGTLVLFFCSLLFVLAIAALSVLGYLVLIPPWDWPSVWLRLSSLLGISVFGSTLLALFLARKSGERGAAALQERRR